MMLQNKFELVLIGGQYKFLAKRLYQIAPQLNINITRIESSRIYFEILSELSLIETIRQIKIAIYQDKRTWEMHYQIYGFFNNKIDFLSYVSEDTKKNMKYYQ